MIEIVAADIGGTHARFAVAEIGAGRVRRLGEATTLRAGEHASLETAWESYAGQAGRPLPRAAAIALAAPVDGELLKLTNNPWTIRPRQLSQSLGLDTLILVNDFGAIGHAVATLGEENFATLCGPDIPLPPAGVISVIGPGTGLGVAQLIRSDGGYHVVETEGGHVDFAPLDGIEDAMLARLRGRYRRVSVERIVSGMGLANIHDALAAIEARAVAPRDERQLWAAALAGADSLAAAALDRFCLSLGAVAGDIALAHGAAAVVIAGGLGLRLADHLPRSGFAGRFAAKGRYEQRMRRIPVKLTTHPQPGLYGAAAAFAKANSG